MSTASNEYSFNWQSHSDHLRDTFSRLFTSTEMTDVTLYCDGHRFRAHKMILVACSTYFRDLLRVESMHQNTGNVIIMLTGLKSTIFTHILRYMYTGEVNIPSYILDEFLVSAKTLKLNGLNENKFERRRPGENSTNSIRNDNTIITEHDDDSDLTQQGLDGRFEDDLSFQEELKTLNKEIRVAKEALMPTEIKIEVDDDLFEVGETSFLDDNLTRNIKIEEHIVNNNNNNLVENRNADQKFKLTIEKVTFKEESEYRNKLQKVANIPEFKDRSRPGSAFPAASLKCSQCPKVFIHPYSLQHHKAVHSGGTQCPICKAVLSRRYNLKMHMKARHNI